jgi:hypothetical protein
VSSTTDLSLLLCCLVVWIAAAAETQDAELSQSCLLVTLVVLSKGTFELPEQPLRDAGRFKETIKSVSVGRGHGGGEGGAALWGCLAASLCGTCV